MHRLAIAAAIVVLLPPRAAAQRRDDSDLSRLAVAYGLHYGTPMRFSVALGATLDTDERRTQGAIAVVEQGQHGSELSAGYFKEIGRYGTGFSLRGAVLRTSGEPWNADPHTTYVGGEVHLQLFLGVGGRAGLLRRASRVSNGDNDSIVSLGLSIGS
jgi:hypothetical protein